MTKSKPQSPLALIEADFTTTLVEGSIKGAMKAVGAGSRDLWQIDPRELRVIDGFNPRVINDEYVAHIRSIADSIISEGFYQDQPLAGYVAKVDGEQVVYIYSGHSRLKGALLAISEGHELSRLPVSVSQAGLSMEDMTVALIRGNGGKSLTYYESAIVCKRLIRYGFTEDEIARRTGFTVPLVRNRLSLMAAPLKLREMVANNTMSATLAIDLINTHGDKALEMAEAAQSRAEEAGKSKVRKAQTAASPRFKFVKKNATKLHAAAESVRRDPGFVHLSPEVQELLNGLLFEIEGKEEKPADDPRQAKMDLDNPNGESSAAKE